MQFLTTPPISRIALTGFMGAGKSTVGALLAQRLGWRFVDTDHELTRAHHASVATLFAEHGEAAFREMEQQAIAASLSEEHVVLALGGGALESAATRHSLLTTPGTHVIFLETPLALAVARCEQQADAAVRPVLADKAGLADRFSRRTEHYRSAHTTLSTTGRTPAELVDLLVSSSSFFALRPAN